MLAGIVSAIQICVSHEQTRRMRWQLIMTAGVKGRVGGLKTNLIYMHMQAKGEEGIKGQREREKGLREKDEG